MISTVSRSIPLGMTPNFFQSSYWGSGALLTGNEGQIPWVQAVAVIGIEIIETGGGQPDDQQVPARLRDLVLLDRHLLLGRRGSLADGQDRGPGPRRSDAGHFP